MAAKVSVTAMVHCAKIVWLIRFNARMISTSAGKAAAVCIAAIKSGRKNDLQDLSSDGGSDFVVGHADIFS